MKKPSFSIKAIIALAIFGIFLLIAYGSCSTVKKGVAVPGKVASNKTIQKHGSTVLLLAYVALDAARDNAYFKYKGKLPEHWHGIKNAGIICGAGAVALKSIGFGQGHFTLGQLLKRFTFGEAPIIFQVWQNTFDYYRYDKIFDYRTGIWNEHRYVIPIGKDKYLPVQNYPAVMMTIDATMTGFGVYTLVKDGIN